MTSIRPALLVPALAIAAACSRTPSEPATAATDAATSAAPAPSPSTSLNDKHPRDAKGNLVPRLPPPPAGPPAPLGSRQPDWDLDAKDPARDYVEQYVQSTSRYGADTPCVHAQASKVEGGRTLVETRDQAGDGCKGSNAVRDTFAVDLAKDRLALADPSRGKPLGEWPDGSDPGASAAPSPQEGDFAKAPGLRDAFRAMQLVPMRLQWYGRGSYAVVSIAGWHGNVRYDAGADDLGAIGKNLCAAWKGRPIGIFAGMDRQHILRVHCPDPPRPDVL